MHRWLSSRSNWLNTPALPIFDFSSVCSAFLRRLAANAKFDVAELNEIPRVEQRVARDPVAVDVSPVGAFEVAHCEDFARADQVGVGLGHVSRWQHQIALGTASNVKRIRIDRDPTLHVPLVDQTFEAPIGLNRRGVGRCLQAEFGNHLLCTFPCVERRHETAS